MEIKPGMLFKSIRHNNLVLVVDFNLAEIKSLIDKYRHDEEYNDTAATMYHYYQMLLSDYEEGVMVAVYMSRSNYNNNNNHPIIKYMYVDDLHDCSRYKLLVE